VREAFTAEAQRRREKRQEKYEGALPVFADKKEINVWVDDLGGED